MPSESVVYPPGPLPFPPSMLDQLRKLGMIVEIEDSQLLLREPFVGAKDGVALNPEQARVLTHFGKKLASFEIELMCHWTDGKFKSLR